MSNLSKYFSSTALTTYLQCPYKFKILYAVYLLKNFFVNNDDTTTPLFTKEFFRINIEDFFITGKVDRIDEISGGVEVIDYKTVGYIPKSEEVEKDLQMYIYALSCLSCCEKYKLFPKIVSQIFLQHNQKISTSKTSESLKEIKQNIIDIVRQIYSID